MVRGIIEADSRHILRRIRTATQGNVIRALVELITNADDSYIRLEREGHRNGGLIRIQYEKEGYRGRFAIWDHAEGMSYDDVKSSFTKYGAATSGMKLGKRVRGYFGQGAKDALASMQNGRICTIKDDTYVNCRIFIENQKAMYDISDPVTATPELRREHKINENGTVAYFEADPNENVKVPRFDTVREQLANNYLLRKIMTNPNRKIYLLGSGKKVPLGYSMPEGKRILTDNFAISYGEFGELPVQIDIWRSEEELTQTGDDRYGGLLLVDDEDVVLGIGLFKYESEPLAARFFGEVKIGLFRDLLKNEEPVLKEDRTGLETAHPFCRDLIGAIEKRLETTVKQERIRKQKEAGTKIDPKEIERYRKAFSILNEVAEMEVQEVKNLGGDPTQEIEEPPNGFSIFPPSASITVGRRYAFEIRLNTSIIGPGSVIKVTCDNPRIQVQTPEAIISADDGKGILSKYITVLGTEPNVEGTLLAEACNMIAQARIFVVPEKELLLSEGMVFQPETLTLRPNKPRRVNLLVYTRMISGGDVIDIFSDEESIHVSTDRIIVDESQAIRHVTKHELEVWGEGVGGYGIVTAKHESYDYMALLEVRIKSKEEEDKKDRKGMFNEPEFSYDPEPLQRTSYSAETGKIIVYLNFPSVQHYLGQNCEYKKTLPSQVFIADIIAERCFYEIARRKVESSGATLRPEAVPDRIQRDAFELSRKYGKKIHESLVDQTILIESRNVVG